MPPLPFLGAVMLTVLAVPPRAQEGFEHLLPDNTVLLVGTRSLDELAAGYRDSAMGRFVQDPAIRPPFDNIEEAFAAWTEQVGDRWGLPSLATLPPLTGSLAVVALDLSEMPQAEDAQLPVMLGLLTDVGDRSEDFEALIADQLDRLADESEVVIDTEELDGEAVTHVTVFREERAVGWIQFGFRDSVLVAAAAEEGLEDGFLQLWDAAAEASEHVLSESDRFLEVTGSWEGEGGLFFLDVGRVVEIARRAATAQGVLPGGGPELAALEALGLFGLGALAQTAWVTEEGSRSNLAFHWGSEGQLAAVLDAALDNRPPELLRYMPADVLQGFALRLDLVAGFDAVVRALVATGQELADVVAGLASLEESVGFSIRDDLFAGLDGQIGFFAAEVPSSERFPFSSDDTNFALLLGLADGEAVRTLVDGQIQASAFRAGMKKEDFQGFEVVRFAPGLLPGYIHYCITDDLAVVSTSSSMVLDVLRRKLSDTLPSVANDEAFSVAIERHPAEYALLSYTDPGRRLNAELQTLGEVLAEVIPGLGPEGMPAAAALAQAIGSIPPFDQQVIDEYFDQPSVLTLFVSRDGLRAVSTGP